MEPYFPDVIRVSDTELDDPEFIRNVREYLAGLGISSRRWGDVLLDEYCNLPNRIIHEVTGKPVYLDTRDLEESTQREWFRDLMEPIPDGHDPYICAKTRERFRSVATILGGLIRTQRPCGTNPPQTITPPRPPMTISRTLKRPALSISPRRSVLSPRPLPQPPYS